MFPNFNIYSTPLLILVLQGLILVGMLLYKSKSLRDVSSLILGILLLITCYHRITYTIGFMGWYDTFRNTKINYFLIPFILGIGPLIYLYIHSVGVKGFRLTAKKLLHFIPLAVFFVYRIIILLYDRVQEGYADTQNGIAMQWYLENSSSIINVFFVLHLFVYLVFSFKIYYKIRSRLEHEYSNTYRHELLWLRNFLILFTVLFIYDTTQFLIENFVVDLHWTEEWWYQLFSLLVVIFVGVKAYFTPLEHLPLLEPALIEPKVTESSSRTEHTKEIDGEITKLVDLVENESLYLDPNLTLTKLAKKLNMAPSQLSQTINKGTQKNFNEFINAYRVELIKQKLQDEKFNHLSILAIALDTGFNSKATFNRVFKKIDGNSPSFYRK